MKMPGIGTAGFRPFESLVSKLRLPLYQSRAVFALGVTLYSMAFGKLPWKEKEIETMAKDATKLRQWKLESVRGLSNSFKVVLVGSMKTAGVATTAREYENYSVTFQLMPCFINF